MQWGMLKQTVQVTLCSALGIAISFGTQLLLACFCGATAERDAHFAALTIPAYIHSLFSGSIGVLLLPHLVQYGNKHTKQQTQVYASAVLNWCLLLLLVMVAVLFCSAPSIMQIMLPSFRWQLLDVSTALFRIQLFIMLLGVLTSLLGVIFHACHSFLLPGIAPLLAGLPALISVPLLGPVIGIASIAYGALAGACVSLLFMVVLVRKQCDFRWQWAFRVRHTGAVFAAALPLFATGILFRSTTLIERFFAARMPAGALSYTGSASQIIVILSTIISGGIATTSYPLLSRYWSASSQAALATTFVRVIQFITCITFPVIVLFITAGTDIVQIVFERGAFTANDTTALYYTLVALMGNFLFGSIGNVTGRMVYLSRNTWATSVIATAELLVYVVAAMVLTTYLGYVGLALSLSISSGFCVLVSGWFIRKRIVAFNVRELLRTTGLLCFWSLLILAIAFSLHHMFLSQLNSIVRLIIASLVVLGLYWIVLQPVKLHRARFFSTEI